MKQALLKELKETIYLTRLRAAHTRPTKSLVVFSLRKLSHASKKRGPTSQTSSNQQWPALVIMEVIRGRISVSCGTLCSDRKPFSSTQIISSALRNEAWSEAAVKYEARAVAEVGVAAKYDAGLIQPM